MASQEQPPSTTDATTADGTAAVTAIEHEKEIGLPQLRPNDFAPQLIWLVLIFGLLYVVMSRLTLPRIAGVIEERRDKIADDLDRAAESKREAETALADYKEELAKAHAKARAINSDARDRAKAEADRQRAETDARVADMMRAAGKRIDASKQAALTNVQEVAADAAAAIVAKLIGEESKSTGTAIKSAVGNS